MEPNLGVIKVKKRPKFGNWRKVVLPTEDVVAAVTQHTSLDNEEGNAICEEARRGNKVAQYIVGMALLKAEHPESARAWLQASAEQGFEPAQKYLLKAG